MPQELYKGTISVAFTLCLGEDSEKGFNLNEPEIVKAFTGFLTLASEKEKCIIPVYCFMPNHQHLIITGTANNSNLWESVVNYKQKTGYRFSKNRPEMRWQKDFYDHIIRTDGSVAVQVKYILDNPVRKGLVPTWQEYPFKGSIGCRLEDILIGIV